MNSFVDRLSFTIGMNLWFAPQISEHCPYSRPGRLIDNLTRFNRPGVASVLTPSLGIARLNRDGTCAETRFGLSAKRTSPFKLEGGSVQSTTGSREVRISGSNAGYTRFRGRVQVYWLPTPLACFPCTSPTVRRRVPSRFNWALLFMSVSTSAVVTIIRIGEFVGSTFRLSVSSGRNVFIWWSSSCTIYESNSNF
jgi:hypothetical protein